MKLKQRYGDCEHFIAYFQPATNTYAPVDRLQSLYEQALSHPQVIGLAIGTRPDCVSDDTLDLLTDIARRRFLSVEYGMQTTHDRSLDWMNRGHHQDAMVDAVRRSRDRGFEIGAHVIFGLPGESREDMRDTARELARLRVDAVKLHNLYVVRDTALAEQVRLGQTRLVSREEYVRSVVDALELLPPYTVIQRMGGDAPGKYLLGPSWCLDKAGLQLAIQEEIVRRDTYQGRIWAESAGLTSENAAAPTIRNCSLESSFRIAGGLAFVESVPERTRTRRDTADNRCIADTSEPDSDSMCDVRGRSCRTTCCTPMIRRIAWRWVPPLACSSCLRPRSASRC